MANKKSLKERKLAPNTAPMEPKDWAAVYQQLDKKLKGPNEPTKLEEPVPRTIAVPLS